MEVLLGRAYNRWMVETMLKADERIKSMLYLPFSDTVVPLACDVESVVRRRWPRRSWKGSGLFLHNIQPFRRTP